MLKKCRVYLTDEAFINGKRYHKGEYELELNLREIEEIMFKERGSIVEQILGDGNDRKYIKLNKNNYRDEFPTFSLGNINKPIEEAKVEDVKPTIVEESKTPEVEQKIEEGVSEDPKIEDAETQNNNSKYSKNKNRNR